MKRVWKSLLLAMILTLSLGMSAQAAVKKITISKPTKKSTTTVSLTAKQPQRTIALKWSLSTKGKTGNTVKVKSSNSKVVSVKKTSEKSATLTVKKAGTATITVYANNKVKDTLKITVLQKVTKITPKSQYVFVTKGKSVQLKSSVSPSKASNKKLTYSSSKKSVATVSASGKVTGKKAGTATITIKAKDGSGVYTKVYVTVGTSKTKVTKVTATTAKTSLYVGETTAISSKVTPSKATNKKVHYTSSNTNVATVSSKGVITAKAPGTATIKVIANDGSNKYAKITVTVQQQVTSISLNPSSMVLCTMAGYGYPTQAQFTTSVTPSTATNKGVVLTSSNPNVAAVSGNTVVAKSAGTAVITAKAADGRGAYAACSVTVKGVNQKVLSFNEGGFVSNRSIKASVAWSNPAVTHGVMDELVCLMYLDGGTRNTIVTYKGVDYTLVTGKDGIALEDAAGADHMDELLGGKMMDGTIQLPLSISAQDITNLLKKFEERVGSRNATGNFGNATVYTEKGTFNLKNVQLNGKTITFMLDGSTVKAVLNGGKVTVTSLGSLDQATAAASALLGGALAVQ